MIIAQISDLHIKARGKLAYGRVDTAAMLMLAVDSICKLQTKPDVVIATGDLVDYGKPEEYALLAKLLAPLSMPIYLVAGNHDSRVAMREHFVGSDYAYLHNGEEFVQYAVDLGPLRLLVADTVVPGQGSGQLCDRRLDWIDRQLCENTKPTILAIHHPPFVTGINHMDQISLSGGRELETIISQHPHVEAILCGHLHRSIQCRFGGSIASTCPSTAHQVELGLRADSPDAFIMEPPGYQLHLWKDQRLISHTQPIGSFDGPYLFRHDGVLID